jgi:hypothetical protein
MDHISRDGSYGAPKTKNKIKMFSLKDKGGKRFYATDFWRPVKSADEIRGDVVLRRIGGRSKVA